VNIFGETNIGLALSALSFATPQLQGQASPTTPAATRSADAPPPAGQLPARPANGAPRITSVGVTEADRVILHTGSADELGRVIEALEPKLRGKTVEILETSPDGKLVPVSTFRFPDDQEQNKLLLWGLMAAGVGLSAAMSGLSIGLFSVSRLRLTLMAEQGNGDAAKILSLRDDANTVLSTLIWSNVGVNVAISNVCESALASTLGQVGGILVSIGAITVFGEILPQAYFSRNVLKAGAKLEPLVRTLRTVLYPVAKPCGLLMDKLVGRDGIELFSEGSLKDLLHLHARQPNGEISPVEAIAGANVLSLDDLKVTEEGEAVHPQSVLSLRFEGDKAILPEYRSSAEDPFLKSIQASGKKWVIFTDESGAPRLVLDANAFLRDVLFEPKDLNPRDYWHKPIVVTDADRRIGDVLSELRVRAEHKEDDVVDDDLILVWTGNLQRVITGSDLLGRVLRGVVTSHAAAPLDGVAPAPIPPTSLRPPPSA
jgi:metal transporter CNNM